MLIKSHKKISFKEVVEVLCLVAFVVSFGDSSPHFHSKLHGCRFFVV